MSNASPLAIALFVILVAAGVGLFIFNMFQAARGMKDMRKIKRQSEDHSARMDELTELQMRLDELKTRFFACSLPLAERQQNWKPVDTALAPAIQALLDGNSNAATVHLREAVAAAETLVADFDTPDETE